MGDLMTEHMSNKRLYHKETLFLRKEKLLLPKIKYGEIV